MSFKIQVYRPTRNIIKLSVEGELYVIASVNTLEPAVRVCKSEGVALHSTTYLINCLMLAQFLQSMPDEMLNENLEIGETSDAGAGYIPGSVEIVEEGDAVH